MEKHPLLLTGILAALVTPSLALDIRGYTPSRHDRFTGFPSTPALNPNAWFNASSYSGVGWAVSDPRRQFVLISPQHFLLASHWGLGPGELIRFMAPDGTLHDFAVESVVQLKDEGNGTDLSVGRLATPVAAATGILPHPYLNLPDTTEYSNLPLQVIGANGRVGAGVLTGYNNLNVGTGLTWMSYSHYRATDENPDDCYFTVGDSGSPSFALSNGKPALVGTHSAVFTDSGNTFYFSYDSFVPNYIPQLDALLEPDGLRMIPSNPVPTALAATTNTSPSPLQPDVAGTVNFTIKNSSREGDGNVRVTLKFPEGTEPTSVSGAGWVAEEAGPSTWTFRRATLGPRTSSTLSASWDNVPALDALAVGLTVQSDGCAVQSQTCTFNRTRTKRTR